MASIMTIAEIKARFESEWVLIEDPETNDANEVQSGTVTAHSKDRDEVYRLAATARPKRFAIVYTGECPRDAAIILGGFASTRAVASSLCQPNLSALPARQFSVSH